MIETDVYCTHVHVPTYMCVVDLLASVYKFTCHNVA